MAWRGALSKAMQELRISISQTSAGSQGAREFILKNYADIKKANPYFPILIREADAAEAKLTARYDFGVEKSVSVENLQSSDVVTKLQELVKAGEGLPRLRRCDVW